jgi:shikimate dehydrogenase
MTAIAQSNGRTAGILGWPVDQSRSPLIHGYWLEKHRLVGSYQRFPVAADELQRFMATLVSRGIGGCNVTVPHKTAVMDLVDHVEPVARAIGAANLIWVEGGRLMATNTDAAGFMTHLAESVPDWQSSPAPVLILGAGGGARALIHGFLEAGVRHLRITNRSRSGADALAAAFSRPSVRLEVMDWADRQAAARAASVVVNSTTLGMKGIGSLDIDFAGASPHTIVADIVYVPLETEFLARARARGLRTVDGLGMLLHQAVPAFERFYGVRPHVTAELRALAVTDIVGAQC